MPHQSLLWVLELEEQKQLKEQRRRESEANTVPAPWQVELRYLTSYVVVVGAWLVRAGGGAVSRSM